MAIVAGFGADAQAEITAPPQGETTPYLSMCFFSRDGNSWAYSNTMVQKVAFEEGNLYIQNLCGAGWAVGEVNETAKYATFQVPQQVDATYTLHAYYKEDDEEVELDSFRFSFSSDRYELSLQDEQGRDVILKTTAAFGNGMFWKNIVLNEWDEVAATPPEDGEVSNFSLTYVDGYNNEETGIVEMVTKDDEVWIKDLVRFGYLTGDVLANGDIRVNLPQYMGLNGNYIQYTFGMYEGIQTDHVDLIAQADGGYVMQEGRSLWGGELRPEYCMVNSATLTPLNVYNGAPVAPSNAVWSLEYEDCFDFTMLAEGEGGEELQPEWLYWQVLVNGEPFTFTVADYPQLAYMVGGDTDKMQSTLSLFAMTPSFQFISWGKIGENTYRCYFVNCPDMNSVSVRAGYMAGEGEIKWSEAVPVTKDMTPNPLPETAYYFTYVQVDTEYGPYDDNGIAIIAEYGADTMTLSGFFELNGNVTATFTDETHREAMLASGQVIGMDEYGSEITLVTATATMVDPSDPYSALMFSPVDEVALKISQGGEKVTINTPDIYLLEVVDGIIINVWCPGIRLQLINEEPNSIPEGLATETVELLYKDIRGNMETTPMEIAFDGDEVWVKFDVNSYFFTDKDLTETICLKGEFQGEGLVFELPQFMGVTRGRISYATADMWSYWPSMLNFQKNGDEYSTSQELWIGNGENYPEWLAASDMWFDLSTVSVKALKADGDVRFIDGSFVDSEGRNVEVFTTSGIRMDNRSLAPDTYIVVVGGKAKKICVK